MKSNKSNSQENQDKATCLVNISEVEGTPFKIVNNEGNIMLIMGDNVLAQGFESEDKAREYVKADSWELRLTAGAIYNEYINKVKKEEE